MLQLELNGNALTVRLTDELDQHSAATMRRELDALLAETNVRCLIFDLSELTFMDSSGIGFIIGRYRLMKARGGSVAVMHADPRVDRIFRMSGVYEIVESLA